MVSLHGRLVYILVRNELAQLVLGTYTLLPLCLFYNI